LINYFTVTPDVNIHLTDVDVAVKLLIWIKMLPFKSSRVSERYVKWSQMIIYSAKKAAIYNNKYLFSSARMIFVTIKRNVLIPEAFKRKRFDHNQQLNNTSSSIIY